MFARTQRLLLRPGWPEDAQALAAAINDPAVAANLSRVPHPYGEADAAAFLALPADALPRLLMFERTDGAPRLVGGIDLHDAGEGVEIGYWVARADWGRGFATEAARAVVAMARGLRVARLGGCHALDNPASGAVLRKLGFRPTGRVVTRPSLARGGEMACAAYRLDVVDEEGPVPLAA